MHVYCFLSAFSFQHCFIQFSVLICVFFMINLCLLMLYLYFGYVDFMLYKLSSVLLCIALFHFSKKHAVYTCFMFLSLIANTFLTVYCNLYMVLMSNNALYETFCFSSVY